MAFENDACQRAQNTIASAGPTSRDELPNRVECSSARTGNGRELLALDEVDGDVRRPGRSGSRRRDQHGSRDRADSKELEVPHRYPNVNT